MIPDRNIKNIVFDFGGVLVNLDKNAAISAFSEIGFDAASYIHDYFQEGPFALLETGSISIEDFCAYIRSHSAPETDDAAVMTCWNRMLVDIPVRRLEALRAIRERFGSLYLLSNTNEIHWDYSCKSLFTTEGLEAEDYFDRIYLSCRMGVMKPDAEIFRRMMDAEGFVASETLFIDDSAKNCMAAESLGINTFHSSVSDDWLDLFK